MEITREEEGSFNKIIDFQVLLKYRSDLFKKLQKIDELDKYKIQKMLIDITTSIGELVFTDKNGQLKSLFTNIMYFINGDFGKVGSELFIIFKIPGNKQEVLKNSLETIKEIIKSPQDYVKSKISGYKNKFIGSEVGSINETMKKILGSDNLTNEDLFKLIDTDRSGKINYNEFKTLSKRLRMNLSEHRIKEIFTSVKMELGGSNTEPHEIDSKEFEIAIKYLQNKSIFLALEIIGVNKEVLMIGLLWLILILLVIFAFIFVGIEAFAVAGTFGAIVNSIFPLVGGAAVSNNSMNSHKDILTGDEFKDKVNKCIKIVQSMKI